jgi:hypothetical protein
MYRNQEGPNNKGDEDMTTTKIKAAEKQNEKISRRNLRLKLIRETVEENHTALKKLSRT